MLRVVNQVANRNDVRTRRFCAVSVEGDVAYRRTGEAADAGQIEEDEDDNAIAARRARVRERLKARRAAEAEVLEVEQEELPKYVCSLQCTQVL